VAKQENSGSYRGYYYLVSSSNDKVYALVQNGSNYVQVHGSTSVNDNAWHHAVFTYAGTSLASGVSIYVDGSLETMTTDQDNLGTNSILNNVAVTIGSRDGGGVPFNGTIDEVRISNSARSAQWISTEHNNQSDPSSFHSQSAENSSNTCVITTGSYNINVGGNFTNTANGNLSGNSTVILDGSSAQTVAPGSISFYNVNVTNSSANVQMSSNTLIVTNDLSIASGAVLYLSGQDLTATGATFDNKGTLQLQGGETITNLTNDVAEGTGFVV